MRVLLLYDTKEKDLARDLADFLAALGVNVDQIPLAADQEWTLSEKERRFFHEADGAVFLLTPGCERDGKPFPSPSVAEEMGRAKERFDQTPGRVIYLVEKGCNIQSTDQKVYYRFDGTKLREVLEALTGLVKNLRASGLLAPEAPKPAPMPTPEQIWKGTDARLRQIVIEVSKRPGGMIKYADMLTFLLQTMKLSQQDANLAMMDLGTSGLMPYTQLGFFTLSPRAWDLVRYAKNVPALSLIVEKILRDQGIG